MYSPKSVKMVLNLTFMFLSLIMAADNINLVDGRMVLDKSKLNKEREIGGELVDVHHDSGSCSSSSKSNYKMQKLLGDMKDLPLIPNIPNLPPLPFAPPSPQFPLPPMFPFPFPGIPAPPFPTIPDLPPLPPITIPFLSSPPA